MDLKQATNKALFSHLFRVMRDLTNKDITTEEAKSQANLVKQANNLLRYELDRAKAIAKFEDLKLRELEED